MTAKETVKDFLNFLNVKSGLVSTGGHTYTYKELRKAIIDVIDEAMNRQPEEDWDKTLISGKSDW